MDRTKLMELREQIDSIDNSMVELLRERLEVAREIGQTKGDGPVYDPEREEAVLRRLGSMVPERDREALNSVYRVIMETCRSVQKG